MARFEIEGCSKFTKYSDSRGGGNYFVLTGEMNDHLQWKITRFTSRYCGYDFKNTPVKPRVDLDQVTDDNPVVCINSACESNENFTRPEETAIKK